MAVIPEAQTKSILVHFSVKIWHLHGGNNFNDFPENQLIKFHALSKVKANQDQNLHNL